MGRNPFEPSPSGRGQGEGHNICRDSDPLPALVCRRWASVITCSFLVFFFSVATVSAQQAQIDKGRQVVAQVCAACHTTIVRMIQVHKQTPEQWKDTVYFMKIG